MLSKVLLIFLLSVLIVEKAFSSDVCLSDNLAGDFDCFIADSVNISVAGSDNSADVFKSDGISNESQDMNEEAAKAFEAAVIAFKAKQVIDTMCIFHAGYNYVVIKKYERAIPFLQECVNLNYNVGKSSRLLADAYIGVKMTKEAESALNTGLEKCPEERLEFEKKLAYIYFNSGNYSQAASAFEILSNSEPDNKNYIYMRGFSLERINKLDDAVSVLENGIKLYPDDKKLKKLLGIAYFRQTDELNEKVVKQYESKKSSSVEEYVVAKRRLEEIKNGYEKSRVMLEEALVNFPNDKQVIISLYNIYKKQSKEEKATQMNKLLN